MAEPRPRLLLLAPLRVEALALLGPVPDPPVTAVVRRLGMGLAKARQSSHRLAPEVRCASATAIAGLGGGIAPDLEPGDIVVADRLVDPQGNEVARLPSAPLLSAELRRAGIRARTGTVASSDHIVTGQERERLAELGAIAVDMESTAAVASVAPHGRACAVVRAISDTAEAELFSPAGLAGVGKALRSLHASRRPLARWAAAAGKREVFLAEPRSFCAGVERAIVTVERAIERYGAPVYVRRQIVHNAHVVSDLEAAGAIFVEELAEVPDGARVVFSAHGVGTSVHEEAGRRGMFAIDATCPLVSKVHTEARRFAAAGRRVVLVGHAGHDEVEGTLGTVPGTVLVSTPSDVHTLDLDRAAPTAVVTQTTLATDEVRGVIEALESSFSDMARPSASDICYASQNRQEAVRALAPNCDLMLVVGSANSSNSNRLAEVARRCGTEAHLVEDSSEVQLSWLVGKRRVGLTAGASAPEKLVSDIVECLSGLGPTDVSSRAGANEHVNFPLPPEVR